MTRERGLTATQYGALQLLYYWTVTAAEVPSGVLADRLGRRPTLFWGALVNGLGCFLFALAHDFWTFAAGEVLFALGTAFISGADSAMLYDSLAAEGRQGDYPRAEGAAQAIWLAVTAAGMPLMDYLVIGRHGAEPAYWITGGLVLVGAVLALFMAEPPRRKGLTAREITLGAVRDVLHVPGIVRVVVYSVGVFVLLRAAVVSFFNPALERAGIPPDRYGTVLALMNVAGAVAAFRAHAVMARFGARATLLALPLGLAIMFACLPGARGDAAAALFCIQGAAFGAYPLLTRTVLNRLVPGAERRATTLSIESMACRIAAGAAVFFAGWSLDAWGLGPAMAATAAIGCAPLVAVPFLRKSASAA